MLFAVKKTTRKHKDTFF